MMALIRRFEKAVEDMESYTSKMTREEELKLYGLMKQGYLGDNLKPRPWFFQFEACAKWDAWNQEKGKSTIQAKSDYIGLSFKIMHGNGKTKSALPEENNDMQTNATETKQPRD
jgi:acyl-CoA-binding protein